MVKIKVDKKEIKIKIAKTTIEPSTQSKVVIPTKEEQIIIPDEGVFALKQVKVEKIPDEYIKPEGTLEIKENGNYNIAEKENVDVNVPAFWTEPIIKDVNFIDYDGTLLYSYTVEEIQDMTELPELPQHKGLICQGWNWTLDELKELGRDMEVGAMYVTDDGKTRVYLDNMYDSPITGDIIFTQTVANSVEVDWGDGSPVETSNVVGAVTLTHTYNVGKHILTLYSDSPYDLGRSISSSNTYSFMGNTGNAYRDWRGCLRKVEIGRNVRALASASFRETYTLETITMPEGLDVSAGNAFFQSLALRGIVFPRANTKIGSYMLSVNTSLKFISLPPNFTEFMTSFISGANGLKRLSLPNMTTFASMNTIGTSIEKIYISDNVTGFSNGSSRGLANLYNLKQIRLPDNKDKAESYKWRTLTASCFENDYSLRKIELPSTINNIGSGVFRNCTCLQIIDLSKCTQIPVLQNVNAFTSCTAEIWIPANLYNEWTSAANWNSIPNTFVAK